MYKHCQYHSNIHDNTLTKLLRNISQSNSTWMAKNTEIVIKSKKCGKKMCISHFFGA